MRREGRRKEGEGEEERGGGKGEEESGGRWRGREEGKEEEKDEEDEEEGDWGKFGWGRKRVQERGLVGKSYCECIARLFYLICIR